MTTHGIVTERAGRRPRSCHALAIRVQNANAAYLRAEIDRTRDRDKRRTLTAQLAAFEKMRMPIGPAPEKSLASKSGFVYFLGGADTPIKIGFSASPSDRRTKLQNAHWGRLEMLAVTRGTLKREAAYHTLFAAHRLHGEWFARHPDILAEIARLEPPRPTPELRREMGA